MAGLFDIGGKFKPRNVAGVENTRFIEPHDCEEIDEWRVKYSNAETLAKDIGACNDGFRAFCILDGQELLALEEPAHERRPVVRSQRVVPRRGRHELGLGAGRVAQRRMGQAGDQPNAGGRIGLGQRLSNDGQCRGRLAA